MSNKKILAFLVLILLFANFLFLNLSHAQDEPPGLPSQLNPEEIEEKMDKDYLQQEWTKILEQSKIGRVFLAISNFIGIFNPFFKLVLGVEYSLSWAFIFALIIWLTLFFLINPIIAAVLGEKPAAGILSSFVIVSLIGLSGVIKKAVDLLTFAIKNTWIAYVSLGIAILILILMHYAGGSIKKMIEKQKEKSAKEEEEKNREILKTSADIEKEKLEEFKDGAGI